MHGLLAFLQKEVAEHMINFSSILYYISGNSSRKLCLVAINRRHEGATLAQSQENFLACLALVLVAYKDF